MRKRVGAADVCLNAEGRLLMVLQGKPEEDKSWSVPSGGAENGETLEATCVREVCEETGYSALKKSTRDMTSAIVNRFKYCTV